MAELNSDASRIAVLNDGTGSKIIASNQCGEFPFRLKEMMDPRTDIDSIADYDKDVIAYVGARSLNKHKYDKDYTNPSQIKFSNIKTPGAGYLMDMKWWLNYTIKLQFTNFPWPNVADNDSAWIDDAFMGKENVFCWRPWPLHQYTDNIHLRINNRDMVCYPT